MCYSVKDSFGASMQQLGSSINSIKCDDSKVDQNCSQKHLLPFYCYSPSLEDCGEETRVEGNKTKSTFWMQLLFNKTG